MYNSFPMLVLDSNNGVCFVFPDLLALQTSFFLSHLQQVLSASHPFCSTSSSHTHTNGTGASVGVTGLEVGAAGGRDNGRGDAVGLLDGWMDGWMVGMRDAVG
jgi:hypothetical protein